MKTMIVTTIEEAVFAAGQRQQQFLDPQMAVDAVEGQAEDARADQDEHHEGCQLGGGIERLLQRRHVQPALDEGQDKRAGRAHGAAFGGRGDAEEDGAENKEDQRQRRDQDDDDLFGQAREIAELHVAVDQS
jgi:hypothetical protein